MALDEVMGQIQVIASNLCEIFASLILASLLIKYYAMVSLIHSIKATKYKSLLHSMRATTCVLFWNG